VGSARAELTAPFLTSSVLCCFAFSLSQDWELPVKREEKKPLKEGVQDMLVKHHLFSWDIDG